MDTPPPDTKSVVTYSGGSVSINNHKSVGEAEAFVANLPGWPLVSSATINGVEQPTPLKQKP